MNNVLTNPGLYRKVSADLRHLPNIQSILASFMELSIQPQINCGHNGTIGKCKCLIPSAGLALEWAYIPHTQNVLAYTKLLSILF